AQLRHRSLRRRSGHVRARRQLQGARPGQPVRRRHELLPVVERSESGADGDGERAPGRRPLDRTAGGRDAPGRGGDGLMKTAIKLSRAIGNGVVSGFAGTAAMTVSSTVEAKLRGRAFSDAPARATAKLLGIKEFEDARAKARFS